MLMEEFILWRVGLNTIMTFPTVPQECGQGSLGKK